MLEENSICPYPGLRPFSEEESLYFKGRETDIDEVTQLLQRNRFLMITGASGDGKSSLVFAGLVPNARAGFFRARFNRWEIAHFRPERSPVRNFASSLSPILGINSDTVFTELKRGFGSLVDLYKNSSLYHDDSSNEVQKLTESEQQDQRRQAANLLVIVDQFEEFFTNPENFKQGSPSENAQTLVNLLLETARISMDEELPVFVVFTMRSDYIGQCSAFRGLAEFIGFSQFFVPRLKRKDFQQIIEEPAILNGNSISRRLVERLLYDLSEGQDQLPILQHALNQIWLIADKGQEEMDLIHYAKAGGMYSDELPDEDHAGFEKWFQTLPEWKTRHFSQPGLNRILDLHADDLYEASWERFQERHQKTQVTRQDCKNIIAMTFACLTKIDDSRAVRNQMTLQEITHIINKPGIDYGIVSAVIRGYREQGNTFLRPFVDETDPASDELDPDTVLDITHESLIRNWERLRKWADKEFEYYETYLDFQKQVDKWILNGRNNGFLLPIGSLAFFEKWYEECRPNPYWLNRYNDNAVDPKENLAHSKRKLEEGVGFLKSSARKHLVTRTLMKYGTTQIALIMALFVVVLFSSFYFLDAEQKQNDQVIEEIRLRANDLFISDEVDRWGKAYYMLIREQLDSGSAISMLKTIKSDKQRAWTANKLYEVALGFDNRFNPPDKQMLIHTISNTILSADIDAEDKLMQHNGLIDEIGYDQYLNTGAGLGKIHQLHVQAIPTLVDSILSDGQIDRIIVLNRAIENLLNYGNADFEKVGLVLKKLDPFTKEGKKNFDTFYPQEGTIYNSWFESPMAHRGGYQVLASLYAAMGQYDRLIQCTDSLLKYNKDYFDFRQYNNGTNLLGYLVQFGYPETAEKYLSYLASKSGIGKTELMQLTLDRAGFLRRYFGMERLDIDDGYFNPGLSIINLLSLNQLFELYENTVLETSSGELRDFRLAMLYKQWGSYLFAHHRMRRIPLDTSTPYLLFQKFLDHYGKLSDQFLQVNEEIRHKGEWEDVVYKTFTRRYLILYPDFLYNEWLTPRYVSSGFLEFLLDNKLFDDFYTQGEDIQPINDWLRGQYEELPWWDFGEIEPVSMTLLQELNAAIEANVNASEFDFTLIRILLANHFFENGDYDKAMDYFDEIDPKKIAELADKGGFATRNFYYNELFKIVRNISDEGSFAEVYSLVELFPGNNNQSTVYSMLATDTYRGDNKTQAFIFLDSAFNKHGKITDLTNPENFEYRFRLVSTLSGIGGEELTTLARNLFIEMPPLQKEVSLIYYIGGIAWAGNYYRAMESITPETSESMQLEYMGIILLEAATRKGFREGWEGVSEELNSWSKDFIQFP